LLDRFAVASLVGALYVYAALGIAFYGIPYFWWQTAAPTIVNQWDADSSKKAYARLTSGASAAILDNVGLDVSLSTTSGKPNGNETSAHLGLKFGF
jgi:hypothetical protein